ncbi:hypothetical protein [Nonomuraea salmonea]|uniref:Uncharacterized protein n=1 Tax=Nonomuraea salmonea TaxID=46181 RepID=A0ABV5P2Z2_9ACTN
MWHRDRFFMVTPDGEVLRDPKEIDASARPPLPVLLGRIEAAAAFGVQPDPGFDKIRSRHGPEGSGLFPEPVMVVSRTPIWLAEQLRRFADRTGRPFSPPEPEPERKPRRRAGGTGDGDVALCAEPAPA